MNLHGATAGLRPLAPLEVLGRFLRALGADPAAIPAGLEEASAMLRSWVAGRRLLLVLDNAVDAVQVIPLLPASPGCGVLVTSRRVLSGLEGARHLPLDVLDPAEALELLAGWLARSGWTRSRRPPPSWPPVAGACRWRCGSREPGWRPGRPGRSARWPSGWPTPRAAWTSWNSTRSGCGPAFRCLGDRDGQAFCLNDLGIVHRRQGRYDLALACQRKSLAIRRELGDSHCEAESLRELGATLRALGRPDEARAHWLEALATFERLQSADADQVRVLLTELPSGSRPDHRTSLDRRSTRLTPRSRRV